MRMDLLRSAIFLLIARMRLPYWPGPAWPRPVWGLVAILWLFAASPLAGETIRLHWLPAQSSSDRVLIRLKGADGLLLVERVVATDESRSAVSVFFDRHDAVSVEILTPRHAPCVVARSSLTACPLKALPIIRPFGAAPGRIWLRASKAEPFRALEEVPPGWGESGFAFPLGRQDVVLAPAGDAARLLMQVNAGDVLLTSKDSGPGVLRGRLREMDGKPFRGSYSLAIERLPDSQQGSERRAAWADFYSGFAVEYGAEGAFQVKPLASDPLTIQIRPKDRPIIRFGTFRRSAGTVLDVGDLQVVAGSRVRLQLIHASELVSKSDVFDVEGRMSRPDPGTDRSPDVVRGRIGAGLPLVLNNLTPGEWTLKLLLRGLLLGEETFTLLAENESFAWKLTDESVSGTVSDNNGEGLEGANVAVQHPPRARVRSGPDGQFTARFAHAGGTVAVQAGLEGPGLPQFQTVDPRSSESQVLEFRLPQNEVSVIVRDSKNQEPIAGASIALDVYPDGSANVARMTLPTAGDGKVSVRSLPNARVEMLTSARGFSDDGPRSFVLSASHPTESLEVALKKSRRIAGLVVDTNGGPISAAHVCGPIIGSPDTICPEVTAAPDGKFELDGPQDRPSMLAAWAIGFRLGFARAAPSQTDVTIELMSIGDDSDFNLEKPSGELFRSATWTLVIENLALDQSTLAKAFRGNGCRVPSLIATTFRFGGCVMPGRYSFLVTELVGNERVRYMSQQFDIREGGPWRLQTYRLGGIR